MPPDHNNAPDDVLVAVQQAGTDYGWPYCHWWGAELCKGGARWLPTDAWTCSRAHGWTAATPQSSCGLLAISDPAPPHLQRMPAALSHSLCCYPPCRVGDGSPEQRQPGPGSTVPDPEVTPPQYGQARPPNAMLAQRCSGVQFVSPLARLLRIT